MSASVARGASPMPADARAPVWLGRHPRRNLIWAVALLGLAIRLATLVATRHLAGSWEYDDAVYFGTAVRLVHGVIPYRDFVLVQPPGVPLVLAPVALLAYPLGTHHALELARAVVPVVSFANVLLLGRLLRHRSLLVVGTACLFLALYPDAILASSALLLEPFLNCFCLVACVLLFEGDRLTSRVDLAVWAGLAFGVGGTMKTWAVIPMAAILLLLLGRGRLAQAAGLLIGGAAGFLLPCLPFLLLAPRQFVHQVALDQLGRTGQAGLSIVIRLEFMTSVWPGLGVPTGHLYKLLAVGAAVVVVVVVGAAFLLRPSPPPGGRRSWSISALEAFALLAVLLVGLALCWPADFFYHYPAFLAPFLGLLLALAVGRLAAWHLKAVTAAVALVALAGLLHALAIPVLLQRAADPSAAIARVIPAGACVVTDEAEYTINADRFLSRVPGCPQMVDALGTTMASSGSQDPSSPEAQSAAPLWLRDFQRAQYLLLTPLSFDRIPWNRALESYVERNFHPVLSAPVLVLRRNAHATAPIPLPLPPVSPGS
ncbi:MAG: hypothetical protein WBU92_07350 [Candidatus Dormiibacterota bacterium]